MKKLAAVAIATFSFILCSAQEYLSEWQEGYFDIHTIATGKGECSLLIFPDGTTELIDCGDQTGETWEDWNGVAVPDGSLSPAQWVARYIEHFTHRKDVDYFLLTHFHADHFGNLRAMKSSAHGYGLSGVMELGEYIHIGKIIDRDYPAYDFPRDFRAKRPMSDYIRFVERQVDSCGTQAERFRIGDYHQIRLLHAPRAYDVDVWNIAGGGYITTGRGHRTRPLFTEDPAQFDENMFSVAQLYRYGKFTYYNSGDLTGSHWEYNAKPFRRDYETDVADVIRHPVDVIKADHHGCPDGLNPYFLWVLRPNAVVFPCFAKNHPHNGSVGRMLDPAMPRCKYVYPTQITCQERIRPELLSQFQPAGHIVVRVYPGGDEYQIFVLDSTSTDYRVISASPRFRSGSM